MKCNVNSDFRYCVFCGVRNSNGHMGCDLCNRARTRRHRREYYLRNKTHIINRIAGRARILRENTARWRRGEFEAEIDGDDV